MSGPTSFAPLINKALDHVKLNNYMFHVLLILADGQVDAECKDETVRAIVKASEHPLSIVVVGMGDGPWGEMRKFDDALPQRRFDNFQFVQFDKIQEKMGKEDDIMSKTLAEAAFACSVMHEVPRQLKELNSVGKLESPTKRQRIDLI